MVSLNAVVVVIPVALSLCSMEILKDRVETWRPQGRGETFTNVNHTYEEHFLCEANP